jgi:PAS domain-containing protein
MVPLEQLWEERNRTPVLAISGAIILIVAIVDWWTKPFLSLGFLYLFPIMLATALAGCGLFVGELIRNRRLSTEGEARLNALVETSPAAIVTVDERGFIESRQPAARWLAGPA